MGHYSFAQSGDVQEIQQILTHPKCFYRMKNDSAPAREDFRVELGPHLVPILASVGEKDVGVFLLDVRSATWPSVHFCFLPEVWGRAVDIGREFLRWIWEHSSISGLKAPVPGYNLLAKRVAVKLGFREDGTERDVLRKNGRPYGLISMKLARPPC